MKMLRFFRAVLVIPFALLLTLFISIITLIWTLILRRSAESIQGLAAWWARSICAASGVNVTVSGTEKLKPGKPYIFAANGRKALKSLDDAARKIAAGTSVNIFPEGTRTLDGNMQDFKAGAMVLAIKSGVDIVPVAIRGTYEILPKGRLLMRQGNVSINVGTPIATGEYTVRDKHALAKTLQDAVTELL